MSQPFYKVFVEVKKRMKKLIVLCLILFAAKSQGQCTSFVTPTTAVVSCTTGASGYNASFTVIATNTTVPSVRHDWYHPYNQSVPFYTSTSFQSAYTGPLVPGIYTVVTTYTTIPCSTTKTFVVNGPGFPTFNVSSTTNYSIGCNPLNQSTLCIINATTVTSSTPKYLIVPPSSSLSVPYSSVSFGVQTCSVITTPGTWKLVAKDTANGCQAVVPVVIIQNTLAPSVSASFATQTLSCANPTILATGSSTTPNTQISWWIPPTPSVITQSTIAMGPPNGPPTSSTSGYYASYTVVATNPLNNCTNQSVVPVYQNFTGATSASFTHTTGLNGFVNFNNTTPGTNVVCNWNFGDGFVATGNPMSHTYASAGAYNVQLMVNDTGSVCLKTITLSVNVTSAPCSANSNFTVVPTGTAQYWNVIPDYPWNISNAAWNWGDGSSSNGLYSSHSYSAAAVYTLCLTVTVSCGATSTTCNSYFLNKGGENMAMIYVNVIPPAPVTVGVRNSEAENTFYSIYPNPNNGEFFIKMQGLKNGTVYINMYDVVGQLIYNENAEVSDGALDKKVNLETISKGVYFMKVTSESKSYTKKMIISK
jgi:PKD repeat protein